jgi:hypothetical protein
MKNVRRLTAAGVVGAALMVTMLAGPASAADADTGWGIAATGTEPVAIQDPGTIPILP